MELNIKVKDSNSSKYSSKKNIMRAANQELNVMNGQNDIYDDLVREYLLYSFLRPAIRNLRHRIASLKGTLPKKPAITQLPLEPIQNEHLLKPMFNVGDLVFVVGRFWANMNKPGGVGRVMKVTALPENQDNASPYLYDVKYMVESGREKNIEEQYIRHHQARDTSIRRESILGRCRVPFCPCFIRDCGHIQPNENEILEYSSKKRKTSALNLSVDQKVEMSSRLNSIVDIITNSKPLSRDPIPVAPKAISIKPTKKKHPTKNKSRSIALHKIDISHKPTIFDTLIHEDALVDYLSGVQAEKFFETAKDEKYLPFDFEVQPLSKTTSKANLDYLVSINDDMSKFIEPEDCETLENITYYYHCQSDVEDILSSERQIRDSRERLLRRSLPVDHYSLSVASLFNVDDESFLFDILKICSKFLEHDVMKLLCMLQEYLVSLKDQSMHLSESSSLGNVVNFSWKYSEIKVKSLRWLSGVEYLGNTLCQCAFRMLVWLRKRHVDNKVVSKNEIRVCNRLYQNIWDQFDFDKREILSLFEHIEYLLENILGKTFESFLSELQYILEEKFTYESIDVRNSEDGMKLIVKHLSHVLAPRDRKRKIGNLMDDTEVEKKKRKPKSRQHLGYVLDGFVVDDGDNDILSKNGLKKSNFKTAVSKDTTRSKTSSTVSNGLYQCFRVNSSSHRASRSSPAPFHDVEEFAKSLNFSPVDVNPRTKTTIRNYSSTSYHKKLRPIYRYPIVNEKQFSKISLLENMTISVQEPISSCILDENDSPRDVIFIPAKERDILPPLKSKDVNHDMVIAVHSILISYTKNSMGFHKLINLVNSLTLEESNSDLGFLRDNVNGASDFLESFSIVLESSIEEYVVTSQQVKHRWAFRRFLLTYEKVLEGFVVNSTIHIKSQESLSEFCDKWSSFRKGWLSIFKQSSYSERLIWVIAILECEFSVKRIVLQYLTRHSHKFSFDFDLVNYVKRFFQDSVIWWLDIFLSLDDTSDCYSSSSLSHFGEYFFQSCSKLGDKGIMFILAPEVMLSGTELFQQWTGIILLLMSTQFDLVRLDYYTEFKNFSFDDSSFDMRFRDFISCNKMWEIWNSWILSRCGSLLRNTVSFDWSIIWMLHGIHTIFCSNFLTQNGSPETLLSFNIDLFKQYSRYIVNEISYSTNMAHLISFEVIEGLMLLSKPHQLCGKYVLDLMEFVVMSEKIIPKGLKDCLVKSSICEKIESKFDLLLQYYGCKAYFYSESSDASQDSSQILGCLMKLYATYLTSSFSPIDMSSIKPRQKRDYKLVRLHCIKFLNKFVFDNPELKFSSVVKLMHVFKYFYDLFGSDVFEREEINTDSHVLPLQYLSDHNKSFQTSRFARRLLNIRVFFENEHNNKRDISSFSNESTIILRIFMMQLYVNCNVGNVTESYGQLIHLFREMRGDVLDSSLTRVIGYVGNVSSFFRLFSTYLAQNNSKEGYHNEYVAQIFFVLDVALEMSASILLSDSNNLSSFDELLKVLDSLLENLDSFLLLISKNFLEVIFNSRNIVPMIRYLQKRCQESTSQRFDEAFKHWMVLFKFLKRIMKFFKTLFDIIWFIIGHYDSIFVDVHHYFKKVDGIFQKCYISFCFELLGNILDQLDREFLVSSFLEYEYENEVINEEIVTLYGLVHLLLQISVWDYHVNMLLHHYFSRFVPLRKISGDNSLPLRARLKRPFDYYFPSKKSDSNKVIVDISKFLFFSKTLEHLYSLDSISQSCFLNDLLWDSVNNLEAVSHDIVCSLVALISFACIFALKYEIKLKSILSLWLSFKNKPRYDSKSVYKEKENSIFSSSESGQPSLIKINTQSVYGVVANRNSRSDPKALWKILDGLEMKSDSCPMISIAIALFSRIEEFVRSETVDPFIYSLSTMITRLCRHVQIHEIKVDHSNNQLSIVEFVSVFLNIFSLWLSETHVHSIIEEFVLSHLYFSSRYIFHSTTLKSVRGIRFDDDQSNFRSFVSLTKSLPHIAIALSRLFVISRVSSLRFLRLIVAPISLSFLSLRASDKANSKTPFLTTSRDGSPWTVLKVVDKYITTLSISFTWYSSLLLSENGVEFANFIRQLLSKNNNADNNNFATIVEYWKMLFLLDPSRHSVVAAHLLDDSLFDPKFSIRVENFHHRQTDDLASSYKVALRQFLFVENTCLNSEENRGINDTWWESVASSGNELAVPQGNQAVDCRNWHLLGSMIYLLVFIRSHYFLCLLHHYYCKILNMESLLLKQFAIDQERRLISTAINHLACSLFNVIFEESSISVLYGHECSNVNNSPELTTMKIHSLSDEGNWIGKIDLQLEILESYLLALISQKYWKIHQDSCDDHPQEPTRKIGFYQAMVEYVWINIVAQYHSNIQLLISMKDVISGSLEQHGREYHSYHSFRFPSIYFASLVKYFQHFVVFVSPDKIAKLIQLFHFSISNSS